MIRHFEIKVFNKDGFSIDFIDFFINFYQFLSIKINAKNAKNFAHFWSQNYATR